MDILPIPASSVPCKRLFSAAKQIADEQRSRLGPKKFEELQLTKFAWRNNIPKLAAWNSSEIEEVEIKDSEFADLLEEDNWLDNFDRDDIDDGITFIEI